MRFLENRRLLFGLFQCNPEEKMSFSQEAAGQGHEVLRRVW
jgi:hypothetical protein